MKNNHIIKNKPWILLVRYSDFFTGGMYIEKALQKKYNVIPWYLDKMNLLYYLPSKISVEFWQRWLRLKTRKSVYPDLILVVDPVRKKLDFSSFKIPTAYYAIDCHISSDIHFKNAKVQNYDFVFVAQKDYISLYKKRGCKKVFWLPLACDPEFHKTYDTPREYDISFVGCVNPDTERSKILNRLKEEFRIFVGNKWLHDVSDIYSRSKLIFNKSIKGDVNMRVFEALSYGRLLLTDRAQNGLEELFKDKEHLIIYENYEDLVNKIRYYLKDEDKRERISLNGQKEARQKHTYELRVEQLVNIMRQR